jgi:solute:Na+ symporter, SSS family
VAVVRYQADPAFQADPESGYIRVLMTDLPVSLRGLMIAAFAAAYMSTIGTQLNWGASYLINDLYRRFMVKGKSDKHYINASQIVTLLLMVCSAIATFYMDSIANAWRFLIALGAGTGLVFILRWFWWRINAWSEISAMAASFVVSLTLTLVFKMDQGQPLQFAYTVLITMGITTIVWLVVTFTTRPESTSILESFYRRVRPAAMFWKPIAAKVPEVKQDKDSMFNLIDWLSGVIMIYAVLFGTGKIILGEPMIGIIFIAVGAIAGFIIYRDMNKRGWEVIGS